MIINSELINVGKGVGEYYIYLQYNMTEYLMLSHVGM